MEPVAAVASITCIATVRLENAVVISFFITTNLIGTLTFCEWIKVRTSGNLKRMFLHVSRSCPHCIIQNMKTILSQVHYSYSPTQTKTLWLALCVCEYLPLCWPTEVCEVDCGSHGVCYGGVCRCEEGWTGTVCDQKACHPLCSKNGVCKEGKCECDQGWTGEHCNIGE